MHTTHTRVADHQKKRMICQQEVHSLFTEIGDCSWMGS